MPDGLVRVLQNLLIYWELHAQPSYQYGLKKWTSPVSGSSVPFWCQRSEENGQISSSWLKDTATPITIGCKQGLQKSISECTTYWTLKQMGSSSRRPHHVPLLSAKNRKRRLQLAQSHQNWAMKTRKTLPWLMSLDFCCGLEFGINNMKALIQHVLC